MKSAMREDQHLLIILSVWNSLPVFKDELKVAVKSIFTTQEIEYFPCNVLGLCDFVHWPQGNLIQYKYLYKTEYFCCQAKMCLITGSYIVLLEGLLSNINELKQLFNLYQRTKFYLTNLEFYTSLSPKEFQCFLNKIYNYFQGNRIPCTRNDSNGIMLSLVKYCVDSAIWCKHFSFPAKVLLS